MTTKFNAKTIEFYFMAIGTIYQDFPRRVRAIPLVDKVNAYGFEVIDENGVEIGSIVYNTSSNRYAVYDNIGSAIAVNFDALDSVIDSWFRYIVANLVSLHLAVVRNKLKIS